MSLMEFCVLLGLVTDEESRTPEFEEVERGLPNKHTKNFSVGEAWLDFTVEEAKVFKSASFKACLITGKHRSKCADKETGGLEQSNLKMEAAMERAMKMMKEFLEQVWGILNAKDDRKPKVNQELTEEEDETSVESEAPLY